LLLKQNGRLCCINLDGHVIYRYDISGYRGLAVDQQGHVYISGYMSNDIHRLSPDGTFRDIVLSEHDGVDRPDGVTFNNDFTKLFIINRGKTVLVYSCKWKIFIFCKWRIFIIFVNEGFLYFVDEGFLYFVDEGFLYLVN
jgi:hypothetical protein